eukprot:TRINITY_DN12939_c0_g1_i8.p4 TRINITY_DN12939_c0_g1~~TRINITY_DN12939_c0_g1_i8.p4  ORF type:complete len:196 (-),score=-10.17 TRINITY_DN12939_c0_g1_i8:493-1080(-)
MEKLSRYLAIISNLIKSYFVRIKQYKCKQEFKFNAIIVFYSVKLTTKWGSGLNVLCSYVNCGVHQLLNCLIIRIVDPFQDFKDYQIVFYQQKYENCKKFGKICSLQRTKNCCIDFGDHAVLSARLISESIANSGKCSNNFIVKNINFLNINPLNNQLYVIRLLQNNKQNDLSKQSYLNFISIFVVEIAIENNYYL